MFRRWISAAMVFALGLSIWHIASVTYDPMYGAVEADSVISGNDNSMTDNNTLTLWYTDEALSEYLSSVAMNFQQDTGVKVITVLKDGVGFLENINSNSIASDQTRQEAMPDMYITSHDNLLRAYLAGIAAVIDDQNGIMSPEVFSDTALNASTCYNEYVGYPLYYETSYFLYNKTYMASIAQNKIESQEDFAEAVRLSEEQASGNNEESSAEDSLMDGNELAEGVNGQSEDGDSIEEDPMGDEEAGVSQELLDQLATMIPATLDDITTFANNYDAPEQVESVFKWDVTDIFYNYFFVGNYVEVGGKYGDNTAVFNLYNKQAVDCLTAYQGMNQFFSIDPGKDNYDSILEDFIDGKLVFTVATTDAIAKINAAKESGEFPFEYGVTTLPDINDLLKSRGLSVTDEVVINAYSDKQDKANALAKYLVYNRADDLYKKSGKVSCNKLVEYEDDEISNIINEYEKSVPLPKIVEAANFWVQLEIAFTKVWNGEDPDGSLIQLSDVIGAQIEEIKANMPIQESFAAGAGKLIQ